jgi:hypothetical protein
VRPRARATVQGRLRTAEVQPASESSVLACEVADSTGELTALFYGRTHIPGVEPGRRIRLHGTIGTGPDGLAEAATRRHPDGQVTMVLHLRTMRR